MKHESTSPLFNDNGKLDITIYCPVCESKLNITEDKYNDATILNCETGILPTKRKNQISWLVFYSIIMQLLGALIYKYIVPLL